MIKQVRFIMGAVVITLCLFITFGLFTDSSQPVVYSYLYLLPLLYIGIVGLYLLVVPAEMDKNIGVLFFLIQSVTRCCICPLFMLLGDYKSLFLHITYKNEIFGILLLIYEQIVCIIAIKTVTSCRFTFGKNRKKIKTINGRISIRGYHPYNGGMGWILCLIAGVLIILWISFPTISTNYTSAVDMIFSRQKFVAADYTGNLAVGSKSRTFTTLFLVVFRSFRIIGPAYLITKINKISNGNISLFISIVIILMQFLFIPDTLANALIVISILFILLLQLYKKQKKFMTILMVCVIAVGISFVLYIIYQTARVWYGLDNVYQYLSETLQSYVTGTDNIASSFLIPEKNRLVILGNTLFSMIPFQSTLFGISETPENLNTLYTSLSGLSGQIMSTVGGGYYLFGIVGAPLFSIIFIIVSMKYSFKFKYASNNWEKIAYIYMCVQTALGLGVYNIQITLSNWVQVGLPLLFIAWYLERNANGAIKE